MASTRGEMVRLLNHFIWPINVESAEVRTSAEWKVFKRFNFILVVHLHDEIHSWRHLHLNDVVIVRMIEALKPNGFSREKRETGVGMLSSLVSQ